MWNRTRSRRRHGPAAITALAVLAATVVIAAPPSAGPARAAAADWTALHPVLTRATSVMTSPPTATPSNNVPDGPLMGNGHLTGVVGGNAASQTYYLSASDFWQDKQPRTIGGVTVSIPALTASGTTYRQEQDVAGAEVRSTFTSSTATVTERSWISANEDLMVLTLSNAATSTTSPAVTVSTYTGSSAALPTTAGLTADGTMWATRSSAGSTWLANAALASRVLGGTATYSTNGTNQASAALTLAPGQTVRIVTVLGDSAGNVDGSPWPAPSGMSSVLTTAQNRAAALNATAGGASSVLDADALHTAHTTWWRDFWTGGASIDLGGGIVERYWYTSLYAMAASNRAGRTAPSMTNFLTNDTPVWGGNWTNDYNFTMPYQGLYAAGHAELAEPYYRGVFDCLPESIAIAAAAGYQGALYGNNMMVGGQGCDFRTMGMKGNSAWLGTNFAAHWNHTHDTAWAAAVGYPYLVEVANFWDHDLTKDANGVYNVLNSVQNEDSIYNRNPIGDISWLHYIYPALVEMSVALGRDASRRALWQDINANLAPYPTFTNIGHTVFKATEDAPGFYGGDANPANPAFPGNNIDLGSSARLITIAQNTIEDLNVWCQGNSFGWIFPGAARVGLPETYQKLVSYMTGGCGSAQPGMRGNTTAAQWGGGAETFGSMETVTSMLMTSATGAIRLFPTWPHRRPASFTNMVASGAFTVSSSLTGGIVGATTLTSDAGSTARVASPWAPGTIAVTDTTTGATITPSTGLRNEISFPTAAGHVYRLTGAGSYDYTRINLAGMGTATASSSHAGDGWSVAAVVDGIQSSTGSSTRGWSSGDSGTASNHTEWAQIDLGGNQLIGAVDLYPRNDSGNAGQGFPVDFTIAVSTDGSTWETMVTRTGHPVPAGVQSFTFPTRSARYLRVTGTTLRPNAADGGRYRMQLAELEIFGPNNLATYATPTSSSSHEGGTWSVANVNDRGLATGWSSGDSAVGANHTEWVQLDLGAPAAVSEVDLYPRLDSGNVGAGFPIDFTVAVSSDGSAWTTVRTVTGHTQPTGMQPFVFTPATARYVRITGTNLRPNANDSGYYRMQFAEFAVR